MAVGWGGDHFYNDQAPRTNDQGPGMKSRMTNDEDGREIPAFQKTKSPEEWPRGCLTSGYRDPL